MLFMLENVLAHVCYICWCSLSLTHTRIILGRAWIWHRKVWSDFTIKRSSQSERQRHLPGEAGPAPGSRRQPPTRSHQAVTTTQMLAAWRGEKLLGPATPTDISWRLASTSSPPQQPTAGLRRSLRTFSPAVHSACSPLACTALGCSLRNDREPGAERTAQPTARSADEW